MSMVMPASFPSLEQRDEACSGDHRKQLSEDQWFLIQELFPVAAAVEGREQTSRSAKGRA